MPPKAIDHIATAHAEATSGIPVRNVAVSLRDFLWLSFFVNRLRKLGFIHYNGGLRVHRSMLKVVLHD